MSFDLDSYKHGAARVSDEDIDYPAFADQPLSPEGLRCLRYMADIESHTVCYLRDLLVTPSHADPAVTTFLTMWAFEEFWHGEALAKVLRVHGVPAGDQRIAAVRQRLGWRDRIAPIVHAITANIVGADFIAVHMAWGAINEWSAYAAYGRLAAQENHPQLSKLLVRIMRQEARHAAFYATQARDRLLRSVRARRLTRLALRRFWAPVGAGITPPDEARAVYRLLLAGPDGARTIDQVDERVDRLPGLSGLGLLRRAMSSYGVVATQPPLVA